MRDNDDDTQKVRTLLDGQPIRLAPDARAAVQYRAPARSVLGATRREKAPEAPAAARAGGAKAQARAYWYYVGNGWVQGAAARDPMEVMEVMGGPRGGRSWLVLVFGFGFGFGFGYGFILVFGFGFGFGFGFIFVFDFIIVFVRSKRRTSRVVRSRNAPRIRNPPRRHSACIERTRIRRATTMCQDSQPPRTTSSAHSLLAGSGFGC